MEFLNLLYEFATYNAQMQAWSAIGIYVCVCMAFIHTKKFIKGLISND